MDTTGLIRDRQDGKNDDIHLRLAGPEGGISLIAIRTSGDLLGTQTCVLGTLGIHSFAPMFEGQRLTKCSDFRELCYSYLTYTHGIPLAVLLYDGDEDAVWREMESWYAERLAPWRAQ